MCLSSKLWAYQLCHEWSYFGYGRPDKRVCVIHLSAACNVRAQQKPPASGCAKLACGVVGGVGGGAVVCALHNLAVGRQAGGV